LLGFIETAKTPQFQQKSEKPGEQATAVQAFMPLQARIFHTHRKSGIAGVFHGEAA
jgi:hypothetical protein